MDTRQRIYELCLSGKNPHEIAEIENKALPTIYYHLRQFRSLLRVKEGASILSSLKQIDDLSKGMAIGLLEGEGSITLVRMKRKPDKRHSEAEVLPVVDISNTCEVLIRNLKSNLKIGRLGAKNYSYRGKVKRLFSWRITKIAEIWAFLQWVQPYLLVKLVKANIMLKWCESRLRRFRKPFSNEELELMNELNPKIFVV